mgnify:CR=1 FL=1
MDKLDGRILAQLTADSRKPYSGIAKSLRTSKEVVNYRIRRMEREGIIRGYDTVIDHTCLGYQSYRLLLKLSSLDENLIHRMVAHLKKLKTVNFLVHIADEYDIAVIFNEPDQATFIRKYRKLIDAFSASIIRKEVNIIENIRQFQIPFAAKRELFSFSWTKKQYLKETDKNILKRIAKDARRTYVNIGEELGLRANTVMYRVRNMEKAGIIKGFTIDIDWQKIGYMHHKVFLYLTDASKRDQLKSYLSTIPEMIYITEVAGDQDLEFEMLCRDQMMLLDRLNTIKKEFPIKRSVSLVTLKVIEINYLPLH